MTVILASFDEKKFNMLGWSLYGSIFFKYYTIVNIRRMKPLLNARTLFKSEKTKPRWNVKDKTGNEICYAVYLLSRVNLDTYLFVNISQVSLFARKMRKGYN